MSTVDLAQGQEWECNLVTLKFQAGAISCWREEINYASVTIPDLRLYDYVEAWCSGSWGCCIALDSEWLTWFNQENMRAIGPLERLSFDGYDPGGLRRVEFVRRSDEAILLLTEISVVLLEAAGYMVWQHVHGQVAAQFERITHDTLWLDDDGQLYGIDLMTGAYVSEEGSAGNH